MPAGPGRFVGLGRVDLERDYIANEWTIDQLALTGTLWIAGIGTNGELGDNTVVSKSSPVQTVSLGTTWQQVSVGYNSGSFIAAIKTDGTLWTWGINGSGELGTNTNLYRSSPGQTVAAGSNWKQVAAGNGICGAVKTDGTLWVWGIGLQGQMGDNTIVSKSSPVQTISGGTAWKQVTTSGGNIASTTSCFLALKTDGTLWGWGYNGAIGGPLGTNDNVLRSSPTQTIAGGNNWKQISASSGIKTDGTLWCWGRNNYGALGNNTDTLARSSPGQTVAGGTGWKQVAMSVGCNGMTAIKTNGSLWLWGRNNYGQLGDNTNVNKSSPVQTVSTGNNWKQVTQITFNSGCAAIKTDGTLWTWGNNLNGALGTNSTLARSSPGQTVAGGKDWKQVSMGLANDMAAIYYYEALGGNITSGAVAPSP